MNMTESAALVKAVVALSQMNQQLEDAGGPEAESGLFEQFLAARVDLLEKFGLPETEEFLFLLASGDVLTDTEAGEVVAELHQAATNYLLSPVRREVQVLEDAFAAQSNPFNVLPEIGVITHTYTLFVYETMLLQQQHPAQEVWACLKKTRQPEVIEALGNLYSADPTEAEVPLALLRISGLNYLDEFVAALPALKERDASS